MSNMAQLPLVPTASNPVIAITKVFLGIILKLAASSPAFDIFSIVDKTCPRFSSPLVSQGIPPFQKVLTSREGV